MPNPVPDEYNDIVHTGSSKLSEGAKLVMWVAEMLENDTFELDTPDGFKIVISKNAEEALIKQT